MFTIITTLLQAANSMTPLGICALLVVVIILMTHEKGPIKQLANNHLEHVQMALDKIVLNGDAQAASLKEQAATLNDIRSDISYVKGKLD